MQIPGITAEIEIKRSARRTLAAEIRRDGTVLVRAPQRMPDRQIAQFLQEKAALIERHVQNKRRTLQEQPALQPFTCAELETLTQQAREEIPQRVSYFAAQIGVTYGRITIRCQKTRWGSCTSTGNLNFNCLLMCVPTEVLDSVIVHELCHRLHPNHSADFYAAVNRVFPDYPRCDRWLKQNGSALLSRAGY